MHTAASVSCDAATAADGDRQIALFGCLAPPHRVTSRFGEGQGIFHPPSSRAPSATTPTRSAGGCGGCHAGRAFLSLLGSNVLLPHASKQFELSGTIRMEQCYGLAHRRCLEPWCRSAITGERKKDLDRHPGGYEGVCPGGANRAATRLD